MDVAVWLRGLGLEQYQTLFRQNDIGRRGVGRPDGRRPRKDRRVFRTPQATAEGRRSALRPRAPASSCRHSDFASSRRRGGRQLTVMSCDLVGSTALSGRLDPEAQHLLMRASTVLLEEHRADRRPRHQHRRDCRLCGHGQLSSSLSISATISGSSSAIERAYFSFCERRARCGEATHYGTDRNLQRLCCFCVAVPLAIYQQDRFAMSLGQAADRF